jgi:hypothetical protein
VETNQVHPSWFPQAAWVEKLEQAVAVPRHSVRVTFQVHPQEELQFACERPEQLCEPPRQLQ